MLDKNHGNVKKYVTVGKLSPRAIIWEQFQLSSSIRLEILLVERLGKWKKIASFALFCFFAYTAYILDKTHGNIK